MTKKIHFAVVLLLMVTLPFKIFATEKGNPKAIAMVTVPIDCPKIASKTSIICSGTPFNVTPTNSTPDLVPTGTTYTWTAPILSTAGAITGGSAQATGQASISQTLTNNTNTAATATYTVTASSGTAPNICTSTFTVVVTVYPKLAPIVICGSATTTSVKFDWTAVAGATGYSVSYQIGTDPIQNIGTIGNILTYNVTGLTAGNTVAITVTPTGGSCFASGAQACTTNNCVAPVLALTSAAGTDTQTKCTNTALTRIEYTLTPGTPSSSGVTLTGTLPVGVTGAFVAGKYIITGTPTTTVGSPFSYTLTTTGGCTNSTLSGTITVTPYNTITLNSAVGTDAQTKCINTAITNITYYTTGATGATITGLPTGVTGNWAGNTITISGTPTTVVGSPFTYFIALTGGCGTVTKTGTITVNPTNTITLTSAAATTAQTLCVSTAITNITYTTTGATGATFTGLPAGMIAYWGGNVGTFTGTPTMAGKFTYTIASTGGCGTVTKTGTINVSPKANIKNKTETICSGTPFNVTPTNTTPDLVPTGTIYTWTVPTIQPIGAITNGSAQATGQASISQTLTNTTNAAATATYTVTASSGTAPNICTSTFTVVVTVNPTPTLTITNPTSVCAPATVDLTSAAVNSGNSPGTLTYLDTNGTSSLASPSAVTTSGTYYIKNTSAKGCAIVKPVNVVVNTGSKINLICGPATTSSVNFDWTNVTGATSYNYSYSVNAGPVVTGNIVSPSNLSVTGLNDGDTVSLTLTTVGLPCNTTATTTCNTTSCPNTIIKPISPIVVCAEGVVNQITFTSTNPVSTIRWVNNNTAIGLAASGTGISIPSFIANNVTSPQVAIITVVGTYQGCDGPAMNFTITINPKPSLIITNPAMVCAETTVDLTAAAITNGSTNLGTMSYHTDALGTVNLPNFNAVKTPGIYYIKTTAAGGCFDIQPVTVTVNPLPTVINTVADSRCSSGKLTLQANPNPTGTITWYDAAINGVVVGTSNSWTTPNLSTTTTYYAQAENNSCISATRTPVIATIITPVKPFVAIMASSTSICQDKDITFTLINQENQGPSPAYQWLLNTTPIVGQISPTLTIKTLKDQDMISVILTSSLTCVSSPNYTAESLQLIATPSVTPRVSILVNKNNICAGTLIQLTATATNGGTNPTYIWKKNTIAVQSGTSATYYSSSLSDNDVVTVEMMSNQTCVINNPAVSNEIKIIKKSNTPVSITNASSPNQNYVVSGVCKACSKDAVYEWQVAKKLNIPKTKTFNYNDLNNGDLVKLIVNDSINCLYGETTMITNIKRKTISGKVLYNVANDDCATGIPYTNKAVRATQGNYSYIGYTNKAGDFEINIPEGSYTLNVVKESNDPMIVSPENVNVVVQGTNNNYNNNNFCLSKRNNENDLSVGMYPLNNARPGFKAHYILYIRNKGYTYLSGNCTLSYDRTKMNFTSATPVNTSNNAGTLSWNYTNLAPNNYILIQLVMTIIPPPTVNSSTVLNYTLSGDPILNDKNPQDNVYKFNQTVVNSQDPNDKIVVEGAYINESQATEYLHYITRFQNTGTASAINIVVTETLDNNLDWNTFEPEGSSHAGNIELKMGDQLSATFENINLEDSTTNEPASHGWIAYKIKPKLGFAIGDIAYAKSDIYFDFNAPIITNTVSTQIQLLSNPDFESNTIQLYPNPVRDSFNVNINQEINSITVFDLNGRKVLETKNRNNINVAELTIGLYLVEVKTNTGIFRKKLIKN